MIENPELRAKILDWQKRYNIQDGDPAIALLELVEFFNTSRPVISHEGGTPTVVSANVSGDVLSEAMKSGLLPVTERMSYQIQDLQQRLETIDFDKFVKQIESYHEGIDYCTKKLDVIKKETDALVVKVEKAGSQIKPVTNGAVLVLVIAAALIGYIINAIL